MVISRSRTYAPGYGDLTLDSVELEELKSLRILGVTLNSKLTLGIHLHEAVSKSARSLGVVRQAGKLFDCPCVLKSCFNAYVLFNLEHCASVWMSSAESHLSLVHSVFRSAERVCEGEFCCLRHRRKVSVLCLFCNIYHRADPCCMSICIILL